MGKERAQTYYSAIIAAAETSMEMRYAALLCGLIRTEHALKMPGGILPLVQVQPTGNFEINWAPHLVSKVVQMAQGASYSSSPEGLPTAAEEFSAVGRFLIDNPKLPWVSGPAQAWCGYHSWNDEKEKSTPSPPSTLSPISVPPRYC